MHEQQLNSGPSRETGSDRREGRTRIANFLLVMLELALVWCLVSLFDIERRRHFLPVYCLIVGGFAVHAWLPRPFRLPFFALLSAACVPFVLGTTNGLWVLGIGGALIGVCYLPVGFRWRLLLLAAAAAVLVVLRGERPSPVWPVLGSMFMFRLIVYVYSTRKAAQRPPWAESVSYFFLLPNACFPLFPVVDYRTFRDSWDSAEEWDTYQRGITWIVRGLAHLLLYRYIKAHLVPEAYELYDVPHLAWFMVTNYALYLQVSGQFHLITGLLHLFGFDLPRTHHHFFLASSFTDIWRRINIYWKDFLTKLFFFPAFYALRSRGAPIGPATVLGVMCVFVATWLLHSWQTFWLLGRFPMTANDAALWLGVGVCVAANALLDARRGERPPCAAWIEALSLSARTVSMFALVSLFWACWTKPGFLSLVAGALDRPGAGRGLLSVGGWMLAAVAAGTGAALLHQWRIAHSKVRQALPFRQRAALHAAGLAAVVYLVSPYFSRNLLPADTAQAIADFRLDAAARADDLGQLQGYYEDLNAAAIQAGPLIAALSPEDESRRQQAAGFDLVSRAADKYQGVELIPGVRAELGGNPTSINQFGMRDRDTITLHKPQGTIRIAAVGSSVVMGYGVADDQTFCRVFEDRLNAEFSGGGKRYEVLNFGVGKQWAVQRLVRIQRQVLGFEPDAVYYFAHQDEFQNLASYVAGLAADRAKQPSRDLQALVDRMELTPDVSPGTILSGLQRREQELLSAVYRAIVDECRSGGIVPVWIFLPIPSSETGDLPQQLVPIAREAGFVTCDLSNWISGREVAEILPAPDDHHPHAEGHRLIADALIRMLETHPDALP